MKRIGKVFLIPLLVFVLMLAGCDALSGSDVEKFNDELASSTGRWLLLGDEDTYFTFDGSKDVMSFCYVEDGVEKYRGTYGAIYRGLGEEVLTPLTLALCRSDKAEEDWLSCYVEGFEEDFTQFTVMGEEEDLGMTDGFIYTHIYRIGELPYKMGTYVLEGREYKEEGNQYGDADALHIPCGTYALETGESFTFLMTKPTSRELFLYRNGDAVVEGTLWIAADQKTAYLYIEHDPYSKVTSADREHYDTTFDMYYPPDFYLRGDFSDADRIVIDGLYHHTSSPTEIEDAVWTFGTYVKQ